MVGIEKAKSATLKSKLSSYQHLTEQSFSKTALSSYVSLHKKILKMIRKKGILPNLTIKGKR